MNRAGIWSYSGPNAGNAYQNNSACRHFLRSEIHKNYSVQKLTFLLDIFLKLFTAHACSTFSGGVRGDLHFPGGVVIYFLLYSVFSIISHSVITRPLSSPSRSVTSRVEISPNTEDPNANT